METQLEAFVRRSLSAQEKGWRLDEQGRYTILVGRETVAYFDGEGNFLGTRKKIANFAPMTNVDLRDILPPHFSFKADCLGLPEWERKALSFLQRQRLSFRPKRFRWDDEREFRHISCLYYSPTGVITPLTLFYCTDSEYYIPRIYELSPFLEKGSRW